MSMFKLTNKTGEDSVQGWANGFTFPNNIAIDLVNKGSYGDPATNYHLGFDVDDLIGQKGGEHYDSLVSLVRSGDWKLGDGYREYYYEEALHLLMYGHLCGFELKGDAKTIVTHDYCNPETWYQDAVQVTEEILKLENGKYLSAHKYWINLNDGFMYQEHKLGSIREVVIKVNDVVVDPSFYTINYKIGKVGFKDNYSVSELDVVKASFWYARSSTWNLEMEEGYQYFINKTEIQVDTNLIMETPLIFEILIDHPVYGNDFVAAKWVYKSMRDFVSGSNLGFHIPSFGGTKVDSGVNSGIVILPFNYARPKEIPLNCNARVRTRSEGDTVHGGQFSTVTLYVEKVKL